MKEELSRINLSIPAYLSMHILNHLFLASMDVTI